jgi:Flp pilus assembly protein TadG
MNKIGANRGAAVVEFAVLFLLLMIIVFGIIEFGFLWLQSHYIANAAREGARVAATLPEPKTTDLARVENTVKEYLKGLYPDARVDGAGGCCSTGDFIEVAVVDGEVIHVSGPPALDVNTIKVSVKVQSAQIWQPVLWELLKLIPGVPQADITELSEFAVFATES